MHSLSTKIFPKTKRVGAENGQSMADAELFAALWLENYDREIAIVRMKIQYLKPERMM
jgi:hypothetical protein